MLNNSKRTLCVFAHPDDEAFGPSGTIAKLAVRGEVRIICVSDGNDRTNGDKDLVKTRRKELKKSASILGVKEVYFLGYPDGELCNNYYQKVADDIRKIIDKANPDTLLTFEHRGVSGHIDHIFCSMVATYLFKKVNNIKTLYLYTTKKQVSDKMKDYFVYFPPGHSKKEVDQVVDVSDQWQKKIEAIKAHGSQKKDGDRILSNLAKLSKTEYFFVMKK